jgi:hypothetical protein
MNFSSRVAAVLVAAAGATACVSHDNASNGAIRMLNAVPDAPRMNLLVDDEEAFSQVDYRVGTPFAVRRAGTYDLAVEEVIPDGNAVVIDLPGMTLGVNEELSLLVIGKVVEGTVEAWPLVDRTSGVTAGQARVRLAHAAPDGPRVDVYLTGADTVLSSVTPFDTLRFRQASEQRELKSGAARLRLTPPGDPTTVLFDSGTFTLSLESDLLVVFVERVGPGDSPFQVVVLNASSSGSSLLGDEDAPADLRIVNASPDSAPLDVTLDDGTDDGNTTVAAGLAFPDPTPGAASYATITPDSYTVQVVRSGDLDKKVLLQFGATLAAGSSGTFVLGDLVAKLGRIEVGDDRRRVATEARLRLVHASPAAELVDIYITRPGADLEKATPVFSDVQFGANTGYLARAAGSYEVIFTKADSKTAIRYVLPVTLATSGIYTAILRDKVGGGLPAGIIALDDLAAL